MKIDPELKNMKVLIVEDHAGLADLLVEEVSDAGLRARRAASAEKAMPLLAQWSPDAVVSDLRLPGMDGIEFLRHVKSMPDPPLFLMITAFGTVVQAVEALKMGADDFLTKPLDLSHFMHSVRRMLDTRRLRREVKGFRKALGEDDFHGMAGRCEAMRELYRQIERVGPARGPVLLLGESGTGKELAARAIHACSDRVEGPFLAVNCAGIPETLMESEFFGHEEGAFTGSTGARGGLFQEASGGTLLLDEIAEMPLALQSKLLRILQDGKVRAVGADREVEVDVRVIAATHQDMETAVEDGRVRNDLFYRLETFTLRVPPLREREDDIERLANRFLAMYNSRMGKSVEGFTPSALDLLTHHPFPGNVRELQNAVERAVTFCDGRRIRPEHLPTRMREATAAAVNPEAVLPGLFASDKPLTLAEVERRYIEHILEQTEGNKKRAADLLGITRKTLYNRLEG